jgi:hypothetical protein
MLRYQVVIADSSRWALPRRVTAFVRGRARELRWLDVAPSHDGALDAARADWREHFGGAVPQDATMQCAEVPELCPICGSRGRVVTGGCSECRTASIAQEWPRFGWQRGSAKAIEVPADDASEAEGAWGNDRFEPPGQAV